MPGVHRPVAQLDPAPTADPQPGAGEQRRARHQAFGDFPPRLPYEVHRREGVNGFHGDAPFNQGSYVWDFDGLAPRPAYHAFYGLPMLVRNHNDLPQANRGFGKPQVSTHAHNGHTPSESDGNPLDFFDSGTRVGVPSFYDQHYRNARAGFSLPDIYGEGGNSRETLSTLFYHDHMLDFTAQNVHKGLVGFLLLFSEDRDLDTGDERTGLRLPGAVSRRRPLRPTEVRHPHGLCRLHLRPGRADLLRPVRRRRPAGRPLCGERGDPALPRGEAALIPLAPARRRPGCGRGSWW
jgi:hypothetical protein